MYKSNKLETVSLHNENKIFLDKDDCYRKLILSEKNLNSKQKLYDFISNKNKLSLKSKFDNIGTRTFLEEKDEAMKKIELNEEIDGGSTDIEKNEVISNCIDNLNPMDL